MMYKASSQLVEHWLVILGQYKFTIGHILGDGINWGDLVSRLMRPKQEVTYVDMGDVRVLRSEHRS